MNTVRIMNDMAWEATGKLMKLLPRDMHPHERTAFFHEAYQVVLQAIGAYKQQADRQERRICGY